MSYASPSASALDYFPCRYGQSRLLFRGPRRQMGKEWTVAMGGAATYGRFVATPWPALVEQETGRSVINLGVPHAGPDLWLNDPDVLRIARGASLRLFEVPGALNFCNPWYSVHPRRNDRVLKISTGLQRLYPDLDFMDFTFTGHLIRSLARAGSDRLEQVMSVLTNAWVERMQLLLRTLEGPTVLVWLGAAPAPLAGQGSLGAGGCWPDLVDRSMLLAIATGAAGLVEVVLPDMSDDFDDTALGPVEQAAVRLLPGPGAHARMAQELIPWMGRPY